MRRCVRPYFVIRQQMAACSTRNAEAIAAATGQTISQSAINHVRDYGCTSSKSDRTLLTMVAPKYSALGYPQIEKPEVVEDLSANNMLAGRESINAEAFVPPFAAPAGTATVSRGSAGQVDATMAGSGDMRALEAVSFGSMTGDDLYTRIADSITGKNGAAPATSESFLQDIGTQSSTRPAHVGNSAVAALALPREQASTTASQQLQEGMEQRRPNTSEGALAVGVVGSPQPTVYGAAGPSTVGHECRGKVAGALYDLLHYSSITSTDLAREGLDGRLGYILQRRGRLPYLLLVLSLLVVIVAVLYGVYRSVV